MERLLKFYDNNYNKISLLSFVSVVLCCALFMTTMSLSPSQEDYNYPFHVKLISKKYDGANVVLECETKSGYKVLHDVANKDVNLYNKCKSGDWIMINRQAGSMLADQTAGSSAQIQYVEDWKSASLRAMLITFGMLICVFRLAWVHANEEDRSGRRKHHRESELARCLEDF